MKLIRNNALLILLTSSTLLEQSSSFPTTLHKQHSSTSLHSTKENTHKDVPYAEASYNPHAASVYYQNRKLQSIRRLSQIVSKSAGFIASTVVDTRLKREEEMAERRSEELLELVSDLGPTFIKVGLML
jgi:hypothetical protein